MFAPLPSKFSFPDAEREILAFWDERDIFGQSLRLRAGSERFVFYEGPPTANGLPHPGHALTRAMKDLFPRYQTMCGRLVERKAGWDTHGLPVEVEVCKELGIHTKEEIEAFGVEQFVQRCIESVFRYTRQWEEMTRRLGFWVNLKDAYVTYHQQYVESVWWGLKTLFDKGLLYQGHKVVWWWAQGGTALSAGEVGEGYREVDDPSVFVLFPLVEQGGTGVPPVLPPAGETAEPLGGSGSAHRRATGTELSVRRRYLPHWESGGSSYFVTFRVRSGELSAAERSEVLQAVAHFDGERYLLHAAVVMPDHVHVLLTPTERRPGEWWPLADLLHSVKSYTSHAIAKRRGVSGAVWMEEYFDRIIRSQADFDEKVAYVLSNPAKRGLPEDYEWVWYEVAHGRDARTIQAQEDGRDARTTQVQEEGRDARTTQVQEDGRDARTTQVQEDGRDARTTQVQEDGRDARTTQAQEDGRDARTTQVQEDGRDARTTQVQEDGRDARTTQAQEDGRDARTTQVQEDGRDARTTQVQEDGRDARTTQEYLLVWTTTPWTLISNHFAAVHPELEYTLVRDPELDKAVWMASALVEAIGKKVKRELSAVRTCLGRELVGRHYVPPFPGVYYEPMGGRSAALREGGEATVGWRVMAAEFVTVDSGSGIVHEAPAFGEVDFELLQSERQRFAELDAIPLLCAVKADGTFSADAPAAYRGRWIKECDKEIVRELRDKGLLYHQELYRHPYPFCPRSPEDPLIQYARTSWFVRTSQFKDEFLKNNARINWLPEHIREGRFGDFLRNNVDWALTRERYWGTPLPVWKCEQTGRMEAVGSFAELRAKPGLTGTEVWEEAKAGKPELPDHLRVHKPYIDALTYDSPFADGARMRRVTEVIDCWWDAGSMPFAQWGYPHAAGSVERFGEFFPADFISEAIDQTRGWFYGLLAISTALFGPKGAARGEGVSPERDYPLPYKTCIVLGHMMGEDGNKMSKRLRNYKEPNYIFDSYGADAMRWYFYSAQAPWTSTRFAEANIRDAHRDFLVRLYNVLSFFNIYANLDGFEVAADGGAVRGTGWRAVRERGELDRWILSELHLTTRFVRQKMDAFENYPAAGRLAGFVDALSNWYVRRSRERFWRHEKDQDKWDAYNTLYECLETVSRLIAPFTPFFAETMHRNLVGSLPSAPESVHLCDYPDVDAALVDETLAGEMELVRELVSQGRAARTAAKIKVRQPLARVEIVVANKEHVGWLEGHRGLIAEELNVKTVEFVSEADEYVRYQVAPNFKALGPKFGKLAPKIGGALRGLKDPAGARRELGESGKLTLTVEGATVELTDEHVEIRLEAKEGWSAAQGRGGVVVMSTEVTPELRDEGLLRELIHHVQVVRKELDLAYDARVRVEIGADGEVVRVVETYGALMAGETLAAEIRCGEPGGEVREVDVEGHAVRLAVTPV